MFAIYLAIRIGMCVCVCASVDVSSSIVLALRIDLSCLTNSIKTNVSIGVYRSICKCQCMYRIFFKYLYMPMSISYTIIIYPLSVHLSVIYYDVVYEIVRIFGIRSHPFCNSIAIWPCVCVCICLHYIV